MRRLLLVTAAIASLFAGPALAHPYRHHSGHRIEYRGYLPQRRSQERQPLGETDFPLSGPGRRGDHHRRPSYWVGNFGGYGGGGNDARARARGLPDCGAYMADLFGFHGALGRTLWVAANWAHMGHATSPHPGAVAVWRHHVVKIVGGQDANGRWLVQDNHGRHGRHEYYRSLRGVIAIREVA